jgi:hypothetical protein
MSNEELSAQIAALSSGVEAVAIALGGLLSTLPSHRHFRLMNMLNPALGAAQRDNAEVARVLELILRFPTANAPLA